MTYISQHDEKDESRIRDATERLARSGREETKE